MRTLNPLDLHRNYPVTAGEGFARLTILRHGVRPHHQVSVRYVRFPASHWVAALPTPCLKLAHRVVADSSALSVLPTDLQRAQAIDCAQRVIEQRGRTQCCTPDGTAALGPTTMPPQCLAHSSPDRYGR